MSIAATSAKLLCVACRSELPDGATICRECKTPQRSTASVIWERFLAIGKLASVITVITALLLGVQWWLERNSRTQITVFGSDDNHVYLSVTNTGRMRSRLLRYRLIFDDLPHKEKTLDLSNSDKLAAKSLIQPGKEAVNIGLTTFLPDDIPVPLRARQYGDDQLEKFLAGKRLTDLPMTLEIDVQESNDPGGTLWAFVVLQQFDRTGQSSRFVAPRQFHIRLDRFDAGRIGKFIDGSVRP